MEKTITVCDICGATDAGSYPNPVTEDMTDRCENHIPGVYSTSVPGMYYGDAYPSAEDDIDLQYQWLGPDEVKVIFGDEEYNLTRVAVEAIVKASLMTESKHFGPITVCTDIKLESGNYVSHYFNADELLAFLDHDWSEGDFQY